MDGSGTSICSAHSLRGSTSIFQRTAFTVYINHLKGLRISKLFLNINVKDGQPPLGHWDRRFEYCSKHGCKTLPVDALQWADSLVKYPYRMSDTEWKRNLYTLIRIVEKKLDAIHEIYRLENLT